MPVNTPHPDYIRSQESWTRCRDCYAGESAVKARGTTYLPVLEGQKVDSPEYRAYRDRAMFYPAFERTVLGMIGMVLRKDLDVQAPKSLEVHLQNLTLTGESLAEVALRVLEEVLVSGRAGIVVDWNDEKQRPFWRVYCADEITNWQVAVYDGVAKPVRVVIRETAQAPDAADPYKVVDQTTYRDFVLAHVEPVTVGATGYYVATAQAHEPSATEQGRWVPTGDRQVFVRRGKPLPELPFTFVGPRGVDAAPTKPPLLDLANINLSHYRSSADLEHGRHFTALPTPWITGWASTSPMAIGSGTAWVIPPAEAKVGMLEFTGQGLQALEKALETKEKAMAIAGARLLEGQPTSGAETAEAVRLRHSGDHAALATLVAAVSAAMTNALQQHAWWLGAADPRGELDPQSRVYVQLNSDFFEMRLSAQELEALVKLWQAGGISYETFYWNLQQGEWARPAITWTEEQLAIDSDESNDIGPTPETPPPAPGAAAGETGGESGAGTPGSPPPAAGPDGED